MFWIIGLFLAICYRQASIMPRVTVSGHPLPKQPNGVPTNFDDYSDMPPLEEVPYRKSRG